MNDWDEPTATIRAFADKKSLTYTILLMGGKVGLEAYGVTKAPTSYWVDHTGTVLRREVGFDESQWKIG